MRIVKRNTGFVQHLLRYSKGNILKIKSGDQTIVVEDKIGNTSKFRTVVDSRLLGKKA